MTTEKNRGIAESDQQDEIEDDEIEFEPCDECDLPDACCDFGCAIQQYIKRPIL